MTHGEASGLLAFYALGTLEDTDELQRHLRTCQTCQDELADFLKTTSAMGSAVPGMAPPTQLFETIAATVQQRTSEANRHPEYLQAQDAKYSDTLRVKIARLWRNNWSSLRLAIAVLSIFAVGLGAGVLAERYGLTSPSSELALDRQALSLLTSTETVNVRLEQVQPLGGDAHGHWFYRQGITTGVLVIESMPTPSDGTSYWGWLQRRDGTWVSAGQFSIDSTGYARLVVTGLDGADVAVAEVTKQAQRTTTPGSAVVLKSP